MLGGDDETADGPVFSPGFRISWLDAVVLVVGAWFAWSYAAGFSVIGLRLRSPIPAIAVMLAILVLTFAFFLFCNVFRVSRSLELIWAALYVVLMVATIRLEVLDWRVSLAVSCVAMAVVIYLQTRKPSYHGVGWKWINPKLPEWWEENVASSP